MMAARIMAGTARAYSTRLDNSRMAHGVVLGVSPMEERSSVFGWARGLTSSVDLNERRVSDVLNIADQARRIQGWTVSGDATVLEATRLMVERRTGALCVTEGDQIVGIITERDYLTKVLHAGRTSDKTPVHEIATMGNHLIVATPDDVMQDCIDIMVMKNIRHLPIAEPDGTIVALLDIKDIAKALADERTITLHTLDEIRAEKMPIHDG
ncbi:CBS domain-containing protein CBSCBSPB4 [Hondaea fermentalgiana]|uniref:CBS domain-containing protein CBSCBSPB4 n=1 Tax=Hondaea fermentalgiana TaxID=2315210 RepID=A0A2R5GLJ8_9STRA|nr:CBS domain-containing protein CBSCBSPB4 [Hondaea fermentalgiana]|eukprot:GBG28754.1 CBS domain-containing protein CBSCBSPB4 [Hondaea fermentalgiana]